MRSVLALAVAFGVAGASPASAQAGTAFTFQGRLTDGGSPASGAYDFQLVLYDAPVGGAQQGPIVVRDDVTVTNGLFTVSLDFGEVFAGAARYLEVAVRPGASPGAFTPVGPRQELAPAPHALFAARAADATTVAGLACADTEVAQWSGSGWTCGADDDTAPTASAPIAVSSNNIALATCAVNQIYKMSGGAWTCSADLDTDTTYANGSGLTLTGTVFATDDTVVARKDAAAGNQVFGASLLVLDYANGRVSIGDPTPDGPFGVAGGTAAADTIALPIDLVAQNGSPDGGDADDLGGTGGAIRLVGSTGGPGRAAGSIALFGSTGGAATSAAFGGQGGGIVAVGGRGGASAFAFQPSGLGGHVELRGGIGGQNTAGGFSAFGGSVVLTGGRGAATDGSGGHVELSSGDGNGFGSAGAVNILGGSTEHGFGGEVTLIPGSSVTGDDGSIQLGGPTADANATAAGPVKVHVVAGDVSFTGNGDGFILRSPNGLVCRLVSINDAGAIVTTAVACP
jgi:hypothetical protein